MPVSWHILTTRESGKPRGPKANSFMTIIRANQDIMGTLVFGGVFERNPGLKVVCVEADAGWVPHYMYRMDHAYNRHRFWLPPGQELSKLPSEYFSEHISTPHFRMIGLPSKWLTMLITKDFYGRMIFHIAIALALESRSSGQTRS